MAQVLNMNQFAPSRVIGELDFNQPGSPQVMTAVISASQATALIPGAWVKLDTASQSALPSVVAAAVGDVYWGMVIFDHKKTSVIAGDVVQIARPGTYVWLQAGATIAAQALVEDTGTGTMQTKASQALRGEAVDPATSAQMFRVQLRAA